MIQITFQLFKNGKKSYPESILYDLKTKLIWCIDVFILLQ